MAGNQEEKWAASLREDQATGLSAADAEFAAEPQKRAATSDDDDGQDAVSNDRDMGAEMTARRDGSKRASAAERRFQGPAAETETEEEDSAFSPPQQLQSAVQTVGGTQAVSGPAAEAVLKQVHKRFRWWLWGLTIATYGATVLVLDVLYIGQKYFPRLRRFVPKPHLWEVIALIVLTTIVMAALGIILTAIVMPVFLLSKIPFIDVLIKLFT